MPIDTESAAAAAENCKAACIEACDALVEAVAAAGDDEEAVAAAFTACMDACESACSTGAEAAGVDMPGDDDDEGGE